MKYIFSSSLQEGHSHRFLFHKAPLFLILTEEIQTYRVCRLSLVFILKQILHQSRHSFSMCVCVHVHTLSHVQFFVISWIVFPGGSVGKESACNAGN